MLPLGRFRRPSSTGNCFSTAVQQNGLLIDPLSVAAGLPPLRSFEGQTEPGSSLRCPDPHLVEHAPDQHPQRLAVAAGIVALAFDIAWARKPRGAGDTGVPHKSRS